MAQSKMLQISGQHDIHPHVVRNLNSHRNPNHRIRSIPEPHIARIHASGRRVPGHDDKVKLDANIETDDRIPCFELGLGQVRSAPPPAHDVNAQRHGEVEQGFGHDGQVVY